MNNFNSLTIWNTIKKSCELFVCIKIGTFYCNLHNFIHFNNYAKNIPTIKISYGYV